MRRFHGAIDQYMVFIMDAGLGHGSSLSCEKTAALQTHFVNILDILLIQRFETCINTATCDLFCHQR